MVQVGDERPDERSGKALLEVRDLEVRFKHRDRQVRAVNGLSYSVCRSETIAIIGESGSGKTASCRAIMGLLPPTATVRGSIQFQGRELVGLSDRDMRAHRGPDIAMVFQDPNRSLNPTMSIGRQISEAILAHEALSKQQAREKAIELLTRVQLSAPAQRYSNYAHQLSGGMKQRVMIAIALACSPRLLIADEATTALDVTTQAEIMNLMMDLQRDFGMALLMISHDLRLAESYADRVIVMYAGRAVERAETRELLARVRMPYTAALLEAIPSLEHPPHEQLRVTGGRPPDLSLEIKGCAFAPRCPLAREDCWEVTPSFEEHEPGHWWACHHPIEKGS